MSSTAISQGGGIKIIDSSSNVDGATGYTATKDCIIVISMGTKANEGSTATLKDKDEQTIISWFIYDYHDYNMFRKPTWNEQDLSVYDYLYGSALTTRGLVVFLKEGDTITVGGTGAKINYTVLA